MTSLNLNADEVLKLFNDGVTKAIKENDKLNLPSVFGIDKKIIYKMPNGELRTEYNYYKNYEKKLIVHVQTHLGKTLK